MSKRRRLPAALLDFGGPPFYTITLTSDRDIQAHWVHTPGAVQERVVCHATGIRPLRWLELQHRQQKIAYPFRFLNREVVLLPKYIRERPMS